MPDRLRPWLRAWLLVLTAGLAGLAGAAGAAGAAGEPIPVRNGHPHANYWPLYLARELKLHERVGLTREQARESFEGLVVPSLESQLDRRGPWSLTGADGLAQRLAIDAGPLRQHLAGNCP